jgi:hypothetical protein
MLTGVRHRMRRCLQSRKALLTEAARRIAGPALYAVPAVAVLIAEARVEQCIAGRRSAKFCKQRVTSCSLLVTFCLRFRMGGSSRQKGPTPVDKVISAH